MNVFVGREKTLLSFHQLSRRNSQEWLLLLDGVEGIGKTTILRHFDQQNKNNVHRQFINLNLNSTELNHDPLTLLDKIAASLPRTSFYAYSTHLLRVYNQLQNAHITAENTITVDKGELFTGDIIMTTPDKYEIRDGIESDVMLKNIFIQSRITLNVIGTVRNQKIELTAKVDLKQALQDLRRHMRQDLSIRFRQCLLDYFDTHRERQVFLCIDNLEQLQKTLLTQETADWLLNSLLAGIHQQNQRQLRTIITNTSAANWPEAIQPLALQQTILPFSQPETAEYLAARGLTDERLVQTLYKVTQGHPLCLVLAVDLYSLAPQLGSKKLEKYVPDPFHTGQLAYNLFQVIIEYMPDEAVKQLLQYGPIFRVLDDEVIDNILAVGLGLAKDRIKEIFVRLRDYGVLEEGETIVFQPVLRQQTLAHLQQLTRDDPLFPLFNRLNRQAFMYYGQQVKQNGHFGQKQNLVNMTFHEMNLAPKQARRTLRRRVQKAAIDKDYDLAQDYLDLVRENVVPDVDQKELFELESSLPPSYRSPHWHPTADDEPPPMPPPGPPLTIEIIKTLGGYATRAGRHTRNYLTSPLWRLKRHRRAVNGLQRKQENLIRGIEQQTKRIDRIETEARNLHNYVHQQAMSHVEQVQQVNQTLAQLITYALEQQRIRGSVPAREYDQIRHQVGQQRRVVGNANRQLERFRQRHDRFFQNLTRAEHAVEQNSQKIEAVYASGAKIQKEAQQIFDPNTPYEFTSLREVEQARQIQVDIQEKYAQITITEKQVQTVLSAFKRSRYLASQAVTILYNTIAHLHNSINVANAILARFNGKQLQSDNHNIMTIHTEG